MRIKQRPLLLLCAAFLLSQLAALLHTTQHELAPDGNAACEICAIAHVAMPPPATVTLPPLPAYAEAPAAAVLLAVAIADVPACPPATGPPLSLA